MRQRGKKSAAALAAIAQGRVIEGGFASSRPDPDKDMTEQERVIWKKTVAAEAPEFFETVAQQALLKDYCRHRAVADSMSALINAFDPEWLSDAKGINRYNALLKMREMETRAASALSTKMRLTNISRWRANDRTPQAPESAATGTDPWR